jgi:hypothetical protein
MIGKLRRRASIATFTAASTLICSTAFAYNPKTHQEIVALAWQVMRAASDPNFPTNSLGSGTPIPDGVPLTSAGACANCGESVSDADWSAFVAEVDKARQKLGTMLSGVAPVPGCNYNGNEPLRDFPSPLGPDHTSLAQFTNQVCQRYTQATSGGWHPDGIFNEVAGRDSNQRHRVLPADGNGFQGLVLGHHAKGGDDHLEDTRIKTLPFIGTVVQYYGVLFQVAATAILSPFVCLWDWITDSDKSCLDDSKRLADDSNPFDLIEGILPGIDLDRDSKYVGLWHFINGRSDLNGHPAGPNWYDTRRGMLYTEAGPEGCPGAADLGIEIAANSAFLTLDQGDSEGTKRYGTNRTRIGWSEGVFTEVPFSPIDRFAAYGWNTMVTPGSSPPDLSSMSWPLHAVGDSCVPMHVTTTTSWGHRPYEDWVNENWALLTFNGNSNGTSDPSDDNFCAVSDAPKSTSSIAIAPNCVQTPDYKAKQFQQAHRILEHAFRWHKSLVSRRTDPVFPATVDSIRTFVSDLAVETASLSLDVLGQAGPLFCDWCSVQWANENDKSDLDLFGYAVGDTFTCGARFPPLGQDDTWRKYYARNAEGARLMIERAAGASIALVMEASLTAMVKVTGESCNGSTSFSFCAEDNECQAGTCCRSTGTPCVVDAGCCSGRCDQNSGTCAPPSCAAVGSSCNVDADCCTQIPLLSCSLSSSGGKTCQVPPIR